MQPIRLAILTVSDSVSSGARDDTSGAAIKDWAVAAGHEVADRSVLPDERGRVRERIEELAPDSPIGTSHRRPPATRSSGWLRASRRP